MLFKKYESPTNLTISDMKKYLLIIVLLLTGVHLFAQNLLTTNSSFEQSSGTFGNGAITTLGWQGIYSAYTSGSFSSGGASDGNIKLDLGTGGYIETNDASRVIVTPGYLYKFSFDLQTYKFTAAGREQVLSK